MNARLKRIESLVATLEGLSEGQLMWIERTAGIFASPASYEFARTDFLSQEVLQDFGDTLKVHHAFSNEAFSKDKFEYALEQLLQMRGVPARLAPKGNPGHDITINGQRVSLKTQADDKLKEDEIFISKFRELGKGKWKKQISHLKAFRDQFLEHLENYDRIFTLRTLKRPPKPKKDANDEEAMLDKAPKKWKYELVEIPKDLLLKAADGRFEFSKRSKTEAKVGYCHVKNERRVLLFDLYFDGGSERKLQIKKLKKSSCDVHATWEFSIPQV